MRWTIASKLALLPGAALLPVAGAVQADPPPAPYSLPWQLRPTAAATVVRSDTSIARYEDSTTGDSGTTVASTLLGSYAVTEHVAPLLRVAIVHGSPPAGESATAFANPVVGATYATKLGADLRLALFLGLTVPVGMGGGDDPDPGVAATVRGGAPARAAMDNAMFAVNDFTVFPGVGLAWVTHGLTVQAEATLLQLSRVRGSRVQPDEAKTNFTTGVHVGYFVVPEVSFGVEIRHQRWLSTPRFVDADRTGASRDTTTVALGPRVHVQLDDHSFFRPGVSFAVPLDDPMEAAAFRIIQIDLPVSF